MFSSGHETTNTENLFLTKIWESECLVMGAYLHFVANSFPRDLLVAHLQNTSLFSQLFLTLISFILFILILIHQFSLIILCGSCSALGFPLSCSKGLVHEKVTILDFSQQCEGFEKLPSSSHHCCHSNMSWCQSVTWYAPTTLHIEQVSLRPYTIFLKIDWNLTASLQCKSKCST